MSQTQDMTPQPFTVYRHRADPVVVLSIDVEHPTGINNYPFECLGSDPIGQSFPGLPHTTANAQLYDADMVVVSQKLGRKYTVPTGS